MDRQTKINFDTIHTMIQIAAIEREKELSQEDVSDIVSEMYLQKLDETEKHLLFMMSQMSSVDLGYSNLRRLCSLEKEVFDRMIAKLKSYKLIKTEQNKGKFLTYKLNDNFVINGDLML